MYAETREKNQLVAVSPRFQPPGRPIPPARHDDAGSPSVAQVVVRRWKYLLFCAIVSFTAAYFAATRFEQKKFPYTSTVVCRSNKNGAPSFDTADVLTLANFVKSRAAIETIRREFDLQLPLQAIDKAFVVDVPRGTSSIVVNLAWNDPATAEKMLNRLVELFVDYITTSSNAAVDAAIANSESTLARAKDELTRAHQALSDFTNENNLTDVDSDLNRLQTAIAACESQIAIARTAQTKILTDRSKNMANALASTRAEVVGLENQIVLHKKEMQRVKSLRRQYEELQSNAKIALDNRLRLQEEMTGGKMTAGVTVYQPAIPSLEPASSTAPKLFLGVFGLTMALLSTPVLGWNLRRKATASMEGMARELGLPVLAAPSSSIQQIMRSPLPIDDEYPRLLALRIQQSIAKPGHVLLFSSLSRNADTGSLLSKLAICFAERDERVLLIATDSRFETSTGYRDFLAKPDGSDDEPVGGLADYLACAFDEVDDLVAPSMVQGVDCLLSGRQPLPREGLGTRRMTELLEKFRTQYTLVIIDGPSVSQTVDLEMLAARADGIIFTTNGTPADFEHSRDAVRNLMELNAPILGVIG